MRSCHFGSLFSSLFILLGVFFMYLLLGYTAEKAGKGLICDGYFLVYSLGLLAFLSDLMLQLRSMMQILQLIGYYRY